MSRFSLLLLLAVCFISGCGGSSGTADRTTTVDIESKRFSPSVIPVTQGDRVRFVNTDSHAHTIVSGTLAATRSPVEHDPISYSVANGFSRTNIQGNLGDTIVWRNDTTDDFSMEVVNDAGDVVVSKTISKTQEYSFKEFPQAGCYTYRKMGSTTVKGTVTLYGIPTPDGDFQSMSLATDRTFSTLFTITGTHKFYILNESDPNKSFITGSVIVR